MKFYYIHTMYHTQYDFDWKPQAYACNIHPMEEVFRLNKSVPNMETMLLSWQEITEEEFNLFNKLQNEI